MKLSFPTVGLSLFHWMNIDDPVDSTCETHLPSVPFTISVVTGEFVKEIRSCILKTFSSLGHIWLFKLITLMEEMDDVFSRGEKVN